jgi:hypothetical protein
MKYEELRNLKTNSEVREYLSKMSKQYLVDYYFKNLTVKLNKSLYLRKTKEQLIDIILSHYIFIRRDEALDKIKP